MSPASIIPFSVPTQLGTELQHLETILSNRRSLAGDGQYGRMCEKILDEIYVGAHSLLVSSCTHAIEIMALLLEIKPGDEVIVPSFTFVSTVNPFVLRGATVVFADCDEFGNLDIDQIKLLITKKTRAVCTVHYAGNASRLDELVALCATYDLPLLEDAAQAIGNTFKGQPLGTFGAMAAVSFHDTKNITSGEGGALLINDKKYLERAHVLREKGTNRREFFLGLVDKYSWVAAGSSYLMSELGSALLYEQLLNRDKITARRRELWGRYHSQLHTSHISKSVQILQCPPHNFGNGNIFGLVYKNFEQRKFAIESLREHGVTASFHYQALHSSPYARANPHLIRVANNGNLPQTDKLSHRLLRLPLFFNLTNDDQDRVIACVQKYTI